MPALATDDFNRADTVGPDLGINWTNVFAGAFASNGFQITSNVAVPTTLGSDKLEIYTGVTFPADQYAQAKITVTGTSAQTGPGPAVRGAVDGSCYRVVVNKRVADNVEIQKFVGATFSSLGLRTALWVDGDTLRIEAQGTSIRVHQNGAQLGASATDSALVSGFPGISYSSTSTTASVDDWEGGTFSVEADNSPIGFLGRGAGW